LTDTFAHDTVYSSMSTVLYTD